MLVLICWSRRFGRKIEKNKVKVDVVIASPDMMSVVGKFGKVLGPKGLMPNPKMGTVTNEIEKIKEIRNGQIEFKADKTGIVHSDWENKFFGRKAKENIIAFIDTIVKAKPKGLKETI